VGHNALIAGSRIGPYEILSAIGEGGMGEVYRARDTKLNRDVAIKILPDAFANDSERLARFKREAQVLGALDHQNIGAIYGFEDSGGIHALVLQLVEGPTLADRIAVRPPPGDQAPMPAQQRCRRDDEGSTMRAWQQSAHRGEEHPVDGAYRRTARFTPKDRDFVPQYDDFQFLELLRPKAQGDELEQPAKQRVGQRHEHETSCVVQLLANSTHKPEFVPATDGWDGDPNLCTLHALMFFRPT
jgi:hypothetical protein